MRHPAGGPCLVHLDAHPANAHFHLDLRYLLLCDDAEPAPAAGESQEVRWFGLDEAIAIADAGLVDGLRRLAQLGPRPARAGLRKMSKLKLDLHEIYNRGGEIDRALREVMQEAVQDQGQRGRDHPRQGVRAAEEEGGPLPRDARDAGALPPPGKGQGQLGPGLRLLPLEMSGKRRLGLRPEFASAS